MARRPSCIVVAALCFLSVATSAPAEGVWVLWSESWREDSTRPPAAEPTESKWEVLAAAPTPATCEKARRAWIQRFDLIARESGIFSQRTPGNPEGAANTFRPVCLPDTVDPRGPKGK